MATYVPGAKNILPDIQPFTPDYKFLSAVLDVRQDKYSTNFKATNDVYNKVVYADLSREDNKERRDQYVDNLAPSLEKIAGMDLSLAQNADSAKAVFAPFFEDKLMVRDVVFTSAYRKEMDYANRLLDSQNREQREKWWGPGVKALQYKMDDFVNATPDQALNFGLPKYVEDADLVETAQKILGEMKPPLKMNVTVAKRNPDGTIDPMWNIEQQNGDLIVGAAQEYLMKTLQDDPRIQRAYQTQSYVQSRDFAAEGIAAGDYTSVQEGQQAWAAEIIRKVEANNNARLSKTQTKVQELEDINLRWSDYQKNTGIIPGSDEDKTMKKQMNAYEAMKAELNNQLQVQDRASKPIGEGSQASLNRAYQLLMSSNMMGDMITAAKNFSMREFEAKLVETPYSKYKYKKSLQDSAARNARQLMLDKEAIRYKNERQLAKEKGELMFDQDGNSLYDILNRERQRAGDPAATNVKTKDGEINPDFDVVYEETIDKYNEKTDKIYEEKVNAIINSMTMLEPNGRNGDQQYSFIMADGKVFKGSIDEVKEALINPNRISSSLSQTGGYNRQESKSLPDNGVFYGEKVIDDLYTKYSDQMYNATELSEKYPGLTKSQKFLNLRAGMQALDGEEIKLDKFLQSALRIQKRTYDATRNKTFEEDSDAKGFNESGMPGLWQKLPDGTFFPMTRKQHGDLAVKLAKEGKLTNYDASGWDNNNDKKYLKDEPGQLEWYNYMPETIVLPNGKTRQTMKHVYSTGEKPLKGGTDRAFKTSVIYFTDDETGERVRAQERQPRRNYTRAKVIDEKSVRNEADEYFTAEKKTMNQALTGNFGDAYETATLESVMRGASNTNAGLSSNPTYVADLDAKSVNPYADAMAADLFEQISALEARGTAPQYIQGSLNDFEDDDLSEAESFNLGKDVLSMFKSDLLSYLSNPKSPNTPSSIPRATIEYSPVYGAPNDGDKTTAGYRIIFNRDWLASKVKGGADPTKQYGSIKSSDFESIEDGVSIVFDQKDDVSDRSNMRALEYTSPILAEIASNPNQYYEPPAPLDGNGDVIGTYRYVKVSDMKYMLNWQFQNYLPGGTFVPSALLQKEIEIDEQGVAAALAKEQLLIDNIFALKGAENKKLKDKDKKLNGKK